MVELRKITRDNFKECAKLKVAASQTEFVASSLYSLAEAWLNYNTAFPFAIYADDIMVGFIMLGYYETKNCYNIWRLLIDESYQGKGYGKEALLLGIRYLVDTYKVETVYLSFVPGNTIAENLYLSIGFKPNGEMSGDEIVMCLQISSLL